MRSDTVTIGTDHVALCDLSFQTGPTSLLINAADVTTLGQTVSVVKVHDEVGEGTMAVGTRGSLDLLHKDTHFCALLSRLSLKSMLMLLIVAGGDLRPS
jgi:hypothetical protein